jgi:hypothetical protein
MPEPTDTPDAPEAPADFDLGKPVHAGLPVPGYQMQSQNAVVSVADNKRTEERLLRVLDAYKTAGQTVYDQRWVAIARTHFEQGFMAMNRAVFKPSRISLPEDVVGGDPNPEAQSSDR